MCSYSDTHQVQCGMLQLTMLQRTKVLQRTRRSTSGRRSTRVRMTCRAFPLWLERQSSSLLASVRHVVRSRASSFKWQYPLLSLRSSSSFLRLLPRLPVTSIPPFIFPSITRCRRQFLRKMWPIQLTFHLLISRRIFLCSLALIILLHFSHDQSNWS